MMTKYLLILIILIVSFTVGYFAIKNTKKIENKIDQKVTSENMNTVKENTVNIAPISHATMVLTIAGKTIYTDPIGGSNVFDGKKAADIILITDIHPDHLEIETLREISTKQTVIIVPQAVFDLLPNNIPGIIQILKNGDKSDQLGINIEAIPMYNIPESADSRHTKGRGNGYILEAGGKRIYIAGDTAGTPEMRALRNIDIAFVPMNLPFTMSVEEAADAVLAFKPKVVHPYHYRGQDGLSDINKFKEIVNSKDPSINVELLNFYPEK